MRWASVALVAIFSVTTFAGLGGASEQDQGVWAPVVLLDHEDPENDVGNNGVTYPEPIQSRVGKADLMRLRFLWSTPAHLGVELTLRGPEPNGLDGSLVDGAHCFLTFRYGAGLWRLYFSIPDPVDLLPSRGFATLRPLWEGAPDPIDVPLRDPAPWTYMASIPAEFLASAQGRDQDLEVTSGYCRGGHGILTTFTGADVAIGVDFKDEVDALPVTVSRDTGLPSGHGHRLGWLANVSRTGHMHGTVAWIGEQSWTAFDLEGQVSSDHLPDVSVWSVGGGPRTATTAWDLHDDARLWIRIDEAETDEELAILVTGETNGTEWSTSRAVTITPFQRGANEWGAYLKPSPLNRVPEPMVEDVTGFPYWAPAPPHPDARRPVCCQESLQSSAPWLQMAPIGGPFRLDPDHPPSVTLRFEGLPSQALVALNWYVNPGWYSQRVARFEGTVDAEGIAHLKPVEVDHDLVLFGKFEQRLNFFPPLTGGTASLDLAASKLEFTTVPVHDTPPIVQEADQIDENLPLSMGIVLTAIAIAWLGLPRRHR